MEIAFDQIARVPAPGDNVAIVSRRVDAGTQIVHAAQRYTLDHTVLEGHRFAHQAIAKTEPLLSWGLPFGFAVRDIAPGEYVCNTTILSALAARDVDFVLPETANFSDQYKRYAFDPAAVQVGQQVERYRESRYFEGYARGNKRGAGTRNFVVILATSSLTSSYVRALVKRFEDVSRGYPNIDGIVAVAHTEGGEDQPNNRDLVLRTLSGFIVHPNVGGVLAVDFGDEAVNNAQLKQFVIANHYPLDDVQHCFFSLNGKKGLQSALDEGYAIVQRWLEPVNAARRTNRTIEELKLALQCGGSDAFSGVSGNPLAAWVAKAVLRYGGSANLAETDELIGAEKYILSNVRSVDVAHAFLRKIETFTGRAALHGHTAEGNPSGGNMFRGLYNIAIKSIGAARKKNPDVRLDHVIDYGDLMRDTGFYFMDSPGNDLESVAGQVASGANLILFTTGNGSITNFPFVPTIKIITTTDRFNLIRNEMDVNAGRYLDGLAMDELGAETFEQTLCIASGEQSVGEKAGHAQVQLWRNWHQTEPNQIKKIHQAPKPTGQPLAIKPLPSHEATFDAYRTETGFASDQVGVVVPTSLCSGQIARMIVEQLNDSERHQPLLSRYVTFVHTEGCGASSGAGEALYLRTLIGHIKHPLVRCGVFLEHGCEKTHNDAVRHSLIDRQLDPARFGWASVQMDGGIERVTEKVIGLFDQMLSVADELKRERVGLEHLQLGLTTIGPVADTVAKALAHLSASIVMPGGVVVVPHNASLLKCETFRNELLASPSIRPTLAYGDPAVKAGLHIMDTPTGHTAETITGLGASGVQIMLAHVAQRPLQAHPMIPLLQVTSDQYVPDIDLTLDSSATPRQLADQVLERVIDVASRCYTPALFGQGYTDFQMTRGLLGISL